MQANLFDFVAQYGYFAIAGLLVLGIVGLPIPDETLMMFAGYLVSIGKMHYGWLWLVAFFGSTVGMSISFWIGNRLGLPFLHKHGRKFRITQERLAKVERWFDRFGKFSVLFGYFIPGVRHFTAYFAGISKWKYHTFALYALTGGALWTITFITIGRLVGKHWHVFSHIMHRYMLFAVLLIVLGAGIWWLIRMNGSKQRRKNTI